MNFADVDQKVQKNPRQEARKFEEEFLSEMR